MSSAPHDENRQRCAYCGTALHVVHVHGHGQCGLCGTNVEPCCSGASAASEVAERGSDGTIVDKDLLPRVFAELGGVRATVTESSLVLALARTLAVSLDDAGS